MEAAPLARPPRDQRLDVLRGWMQLSIFVSHVVGTSLAWGIHAAWGLSDSSEMFVLLSGFTLGSVFSLKLARSGPLAAQRDMLARSFRLYRTHLTVFFMFAAMVIAADMFVPMPFAVDRFGWRFLVDMPWAALPAAASMLYQPDFMGILPVFVFGMLLLGPFLLAATRLGGWALAPSFLVYLAAWWGWIATPGLGGTTVEFDPLAWQFLYLLGAWMGRRSLHRQPLPRAPWMLVGAGAILVLGLAARLVEHGFVEGPALAGWALQHKEVLAPPRLIHALALAYLVAVLVPRQAAWMEAPLGRGLAAIGRNSLRVFCVGLFLAWGVSRVAEVQPALGLPLALLGIAALWAVALFSEGWRPLQGLVPGSRGP